MTIDAGIVRDARNGRVYAIHEPSGEIYAVQVTDGAVTACCGPISREAALVTLAEDVPLSHYDPADNDWAAGESWRIVHAGIDGRFYQD